MLSVDELERAEREIVKHVQRGPMSFAEDQFHKILPSGNYGAKELKDAGLHA